MEVVETYSRITGIPKQRVNLSDETKVKISEAVQTYTLQRIKYALEYAYQNEKYGSPDKYNLAYLFTPGLIDMLVAFSHEFVMKRNYHWKVSESMSQEKWVHEMLAV